MPKSSTDQLLDSAASGEAGLLAGSTESPDKGTHLKASKKAVSSMAIAMITFSCVAGGPFGVEVAVQCAGALATVLGLCIAGVLWGLPQALITAELAAALPSNGGPVHWVTRAFGRRWGFVNGVLLVIQQAVDICTYPTLIASYAASALGGGASHGVLYAVKAGALAIAVVLNILGIDALSTSAGVLTALVMLPFALLPVVAGATGAAFDWGALGPAGTPAGWHASLAVFVSTVLWNMQGWSEVGCVAGEVAAAEIVFPRGMVIASALVTGAYALPVLVGVALNPDTALWADGYFFTVAGGVAPWLGYLVLASAVLANLSTLQASLAAYSRTLQAAAREGFVPIRLLAANQTRFETPVAAIAVLAASTLILTWDLGFADLVVVDSCFYLVCQASVFAAFLRLRHAEPDLPRPYRFPGGTPGAVAAGGVCGALVACGLAMAFASGGLAAGVAVAATLTVLFGLSFVWSGVRCCAAAADALHDEWAEEEVEGGLAEAEDRCSSTSSGSSSSIGLLAGAGSDIGGSFSVGASLSPQPVGKTALAASVPGTAVAVVPASSSPSTLAAPPRPSALQRLLFGSFGVAPPQAAAALEAARSRSCSESWRPRSASIALVLLAQAPSVSPLLAAAASHRGNLGALQPDDAAWGLVARESL